MKCIYSKKLDETYISQEHIIPAFLGGKLKLPIGYVSDQTNNLFSGLEYQLSHYSGLSFIRSMNGPGKRGKLDYESYPLIAYSNNGRGYLTIKRNNHITLITQLEFLFDDNTFSAIGITANASSTKAGFNEVNELRLALEAKTDERSIIFMQDALSFNNRVVVSLYKSKWHILANKRISLEEIKNLIKIKKANKDSNKYMQPPIQSELSIGKICQDNEATERSVLKIIFNAYAHFLGAEKALFYGFDHIRDFIYNGKIPEGGLVVFKGFMDLKQIYLDFNLEQMSHLIVLFPFENAFYGLASFYGGQFVRAYRLSDTSEIESMYMFSCDWKNNIENVFIEKTSKTGLYFKSHQQAHKEEMLQSDTILGRKVDNRVASLVKQLEIKFPEYKYFVEFNSDQSIGFSNVLFSDKFKAGLIQVNWALDDNTYNEVLVQTLTFILNNNDQIIVTVAPSNSNNQGEVVISNYINQLLTWGLQDSKSKEYNYNPSQIYNIRNMQLISNI
jgi:hypothetical protein